MKALALIMTMICCFACFMAGYDMGEKKGKPILCKVIEEVHDTITSVPDTIVKEVVLGERVVKVAVRDTIHSVDTIEVALPITQREYEDSTYHAWVSGYEPALDSIKVYRQTRVITNTIYKYNKEKRWGVFGGVGVGVTSKGLAPCVAVGIGYGL